MLAPCGVRRAATQWCVSPAKCSMMPTAALATANTSWLNLTHGVGRSRLADASLCGSLCGHCNIAQQQARRVARRRAARQRQHTWMASSRVGERTRAKFFVCFSSRSCRMGSAKAPVLPEPVCARPMTSFPALHHKHDSTEDKNLLECERRQAKLRNLVLAAGEGATRVISPGGTNLAAGAAQLVLGQL